MSEEQISFWENIKTVFLMWRRRLFVFLVVIGPGIITAVANNDAAGVATYTVAASMFGMASRFLIIPEMLLLIVTQEVGARIAIVTKKGLADLIRERFGIKIAIFIFILYYIVNQAVVLQEIGGIKASLSIFNLPWQLLLILTCMLLIFSVVRFNYRRLERIFLVMIFFYFSYVMVAIITRPHWGEALRESFLWPQDTKLDFNYWFSRIAVLGTTVTAWGQFFIQSYVAEKKLSEEHLRYQKFEIIIGVLLTTFLSFMMGVAVSETLFKNNLVVTDGYLAALALKPFAGELAQGLFAAGLFGASLLGLAIVPLATAYVFAELFGYEGGLDIDFKKGRLFYSFFISQIVIALFIILIPQISIFRITLSLNFLNGAILPLIFYFVIKFSESKEIMGKYAVSGLTGVFLRAVAILLTLAVVVSFIGRLLKFI